MKEHSQCNGFDELIEEQKLNKFWFVTGMRKFEEIHSKLILVNKKVIENKKLMFSNFQNNYAVLYANELTIIL